MTEIEIAADLAPADQLKPTPDFWFQLIDEKAAGEFLHLTTRSMQAMRQRGGGPRFIRISARCIRYRRADLKAWAENKLRRSTSDPGTEAAAP